MNLTALYKKISTKAPLFLLSETILYLFLSPLVLTSAPLHNLIFFVILTFFNITFIRLLCLVENMKRYKNLTFCCLYFFAAVLIFYTINFSIAGMSLLDWILSGAGFDLRYMPFITVISIVSIIFVSTTIFYFTEICFRGIILIFLMYIPLCYNYVLVKELTSLEIFFLCVSLILIIIKGLRKNISSSYIKNKEGLYLLAGIVIIMTAVITFALPKSLKTPYSKVLDNIMAYNPFESKGINQLGSLNDFSGASNYRNINANRLLYTVEANETLYLKKTSFFDYNSGQWVIPSDMPLKTMNVKQYSHNTNVAEFYNFLRDIYKDKKEVFDKYGIKLEDIPKTKIIKQNAKIKAEKFRANFAIAPLKSIEIKVDGRDIPKNLLGASFLPYVDSNMEYTTTYYSDDLKYQKEVTNFSDKFNLKTYNGFLTELIEDRYKAYPSVFDHIFELYQASFYEKNISYDSPKIKSLAEEITKGLYSDYDKAEALENYFRLNDYVYSLDYVPEDNSIEYFIFNSKTGACGDYATAMTLMARSIGLSARYTEGFVTTPVLDEKGKYTITGNDAHAYVEVYIPGYGFSVFDPTVASNNEENAQNNNTGTIARLSFILRNYVALGIALILIVCGALYLVVIWLSPKAKDMLFIKRLKAMDKKTAEIYKYIRELITKEHKREREKLLALTPKEMAIFIKDKYEIDIDFLISALEKEYYAQRDISFEEIEKIREIIGNIRKNKKKKIKKKKK